MDVLSPIQLDDFFTNGYLVLEDFVSTTTCQRLIKRMDKIIADNQSQIPSVVFSTHNNSHAKADYFLSSADKIHFFLEPKALNQQGELTRPIAESLNKVGHGLHVCDDEFKAFSFDKRLNQICQQLGFGLVGLLQSMYIFKQPNIGEEVNWHQDSTYLHMVNSDVIGFWFALEDATIENGCLQVIPSPNVTPLRERMIMHNGRSEIIKLNYRNWDQSQIKYVEVKQGSLVMLHGRLPHASGPNGSALSRHAYTLHCVDRSKTYSSNNWLQWPNHEIPGF